MPLFDFQCADCTVVEERLVSSNRITVWCKQCNSPKPMERLISSASFSVNGQYTARTGYADAQVVHKDHGNGIKTTVKGHFEQHDNITQRRERIQSR